MKAYIVRPYFGYDCDSESGFNNGHYLDDVAVFAVDKDAAVSAAMEAYQQNHQLHPSAEVDGEFGDGTIYWVDCYNDGDGNEISEEQYGALSDDTGGYLYQYIDFNAVEPVTDDISYDQEPETNPDR